MKHRSIPILVKLGLIAFIGLSSSIRGATPRDYPIQPVPFTAVKVQDGFWTPRFETNRQVTVWYDFHKCEETGRIDNFAKAAGLMEGPFKGIPFDDSDVYKVIEGAAYILAMQPDPKLDKYLDDLIAKIAAAQESDGYLYTARRLFPPEKMPKMSGPTRWSNLASSHELYNVGHLYEGAVAHFQATGKRALLNVAIKNADFLVKTFGQGKVQEPPGHEEIEIGLVKLYRATGNEDYLKLAKYFLDIRGRPETHKLRGANQQDHQPVIEQSEAVGHAVRAGYLYSGMADVAAITGEKAYVTAIGRIWEDVVSGKLHLTGGIGARHAGEAFGDKYELPNRSAYLETCAAIANALWNHRMFLMHGDAKYLDVLERVIYNGFLSGVSMSGDRFFYPNPLEFDGRSKFNHGSNTRAPWFGCSCCPVNDVRFIPSIAGYVYALRNDELYVNLFIGGAAEAKVGGASVKLSQETRYPWDGAVRIKVDPARSGSFAVNVRIPGWAQGRPVPGDLYRYDGGGADVPMIKINGKAEKYKLQNGFARLERKWKSGELIDLNLPMPVRRVHAHEGVKDNLGRVAIERGPVVYCAEAVDNGGKVLNHLLPDSASFQTEHRADLLNGVTVVRASGTATATRDEAGNIVTKPATLTLVPYYAWSHRDLGEMAVWLPRTLDKVVVPPPPTIAGLGKVTASHVWRADHSNALNDSIEPRNSNDHDVPRFTWWDHRGTEEWVQYEFDKPTPVSAVSVYWFDDTGRGSCRVPKSWKLLYREGDQWKPVPANDGFGVAKDRYNRIGFSPVTTRALRVVAELQPSFSGGILEWKVE